MIRALLLAAAGLLAAQEVSETFQNVEVRPGDTLWSISNKYLKDPAKWDRILQYNKLPSSDPTVALPGMVLRVPVSMIKESMRAATLITLRNQVMVRRRQTTNWDAAKLKMLLFQGDVLRTMADSMAVVEFLNKETLGLNANSMAVIKPADKAYDIELTRGAIMASNAVIHTPGAVIAPATKGAKFMASVRDDQSTVVAVFEGEANVKAAGKTVKVGAGKGMEIALGMAPGLPKNIADIKDAAIHSAQMSEAAALLGWKPPEVKAPPKTAVALPTKAASVGDVADDLQKMKVGVPISAYHVQFSPTEDFSNIVFDKYYEADTPFNPVNVELRPGAYWGRIALVDLLSSEGKFSAPKRYTVGRR